ncbi:MAG: hypothetical protein ACRENG_25320 [bacterium]
MKIRKQIVVWEIDKISQRLAENWRTTFSYDDAVVVAIVNRCMGWKSSTRNIDHILTQTLHPESRWSFWREWWKEKLFQVSLFPLMNMVD